MIDEQINIALETRESLGRNPFQFFANVLQPSDSCLCRANFKLIPIFANPFILLVRQIVRFADLLIANLSITKKPLVC